LPLAGGGAPTKRGRTSPGASGATLTGDGVRIFGGASDKRSSIASKFESPSVSSGRRTSTTVVIGNAADETGGAGTGSGSPFFQPSGGLTITIPPHLGQARICPIADSSRTFSRVLQVVQEMEKRSIGHFQFQIAHFKFEI
jgi:hypothetical protein